MFDYKNFTFNSFINYVLKRMKLEDLDEKIKEEFSKEIFIALSDRLISSMFQAMKEDDIKRYTQILEENTDITDLEALLIVVDEIPHLHDILVKNVNELADELTRDAERIDKALAKEKNEANEK